LRHQKWGNPSKTAKNRGNSQYQCNIKHQKGAMALIRGMAGN
jgi:hypothetical protein